MTGLANDVLADDRGVPDYDEPVLVESEGQYSQDVTCRSRHGVVHERAHSLSALGYCRGRIGAVLAFLSNESYWYDIRVNT